MNVGDKVVTCFGTGFITKIHTRLHPDDVQLLEVQLADNTSVLVGEPEAWVST